MNDNRMRARNRWGKSGLRSQKLNAVLCINRLSQVFCFSKIRASKGEALALVLTNALLIDNKWLTFPRLKERGSIEALRAFYPSPFPVKEPLMPKGVEHAYHDQAQ